MPDTVTDMVYWALTLVLALTLGYIGYTAKWGFESLINRMKQMEETMNRFTLEMASEREQRKDHYHTLERRVDRLETRCEMRHEETENA